MEERKALRSNSIKALPSLSIYGANREARRRLLRQTYKEAFLTYEEAKRTIREEDRKQLEKFKSYSGYIKNQILFIKEEAAREGKTLTDQEALDILTKRAEEARRQELLEGSDEE